MRRKNRKYLWLLLILLVVTVGYAAISTTLKINGSATVTKQTWDVYWDTPVVTAGSKSMTAPIRGADSGDPANTKLTWSVTLDLPGDYYEFTVDAVNNGSIDAMITGITPTVSPTLPTNPDYIKYSVTYADGIAPAVNHLLAKKTGNAPTTEKYKVRVYYDETVATAASINAMTTSTTYTFTLNITYGQATSDAIPKPRVWTLPEGKTADTLSVGDEICNSDQCFNFIKYDGNDVVMLAQYNLNVGRNAKGTETFLQDSDVRGNVSGITNYGAVVFSTTNYWDDNGSPKSDYTGSYFPGPNYPTVYDAINYADAPGILDLNYRPTNPNYSVAYYVEQYKAKLINDYHATIKDARLLYVSEAMDSTIGCDDFDTACPTTGPSAFITNTSFWTGTAGYTEGIFRVQADGLFTWAQYNNAATASFGVRPVIVVEKSNL